MGRHITEIHETISTHASCRMSERSIKEWQVDQVISYGRESYNRKAVIYAVGRKEIREHGKFLEPCEGIHVVCSPQDGTIITTYRNHDLRGLRH